jgi:CRP/FNR family transcriptional regulator, cyclic AMP receptor protein
MKKSNVMYVEQGLVRLSVLSHAGKQAVIAVLDAGHFFGEGCLVGAATADGNRLGHGACTIVVVEKQEMVRQLHARRRSRIGSSRTC